MSLQLLILLNLTVSSMLTGLIWIVQLVHYPGFLLIGKEECVAYQKHHTSKISWIVIPLMIIELGLAFWLLLTPFLFTEIKLLNYAAFSFVLIVWLTTFVKAVPLHNQLSKHGYKEKTIKSLIKINWIRTTAWTLRTATLLFLIYFYI